MPYEVVDDERVLEQRLAQWQSSNDFAFVLANDRQLISALVKQLRAAVVRLGLCDEANCIRLGVALEEALVNALVHGNLEIDSALREREDDAYRQLIETRLGISPFRERRIYVHGRLTNDRAVFTIRDEGPGFNVSALPDPRTPDHITRVGGRGILLMRSLMDEVVYSHGGRQVMLALNGVDQREIAATTRYA